MNEEITEQEENDFEKAKDARKTAKRFVRSLGKERVRLGIVLLSVIVYSATNIMAPLYSATAVDAIWSRIKETRALGEPFGITWEYGGRQIFVLLCIYALSGLFYIFQNFLMASFAERLNYRFRGEIAEKLSRLPLSFYDKHRVGELMSRATNDLDKVSEVLQTGLIRLFTYIGTVIGSFVMMLRFSFALTAVFVLFVALSTLITGIVSRRTLRYAARRQTAVGRMNGLVEESYSGRTVIKAFNYEERSLEKMREASEELASTSEKTDFMMNAVTPATRLVNRCGMVLIAILGGEMLISGKMTPGGFQAFFQYMNQSGEPITELAYMISSLQSALASVERVYELLDAPEMEPETSVSKLIDRARGEIEFSHISFGYAPDRLLMTDVSFKAEPGQKIAIVGSTGAGKTTLVNLLMRFYETDGGRILLDGVPTSDMTRGELRRCFGMVLQDTWLLRER